MSRHQIGIHRVFVDVDVELAHARESAQVLLFKRLCLSRFGFKVRVDFRLVGVIVRKGRVNLSQ